MAIQRPRHLFSRGFSIPHRLVLLPATSASPDSLSEMQIIRLIPEALNQKPRGKGQALYTFGSPPGGSDAHHAWESLPTASESAASGLWKFRDWTRYTCPLKALSQKRCTSLPSMSYWWVLINSSASMQAAGVTCVLCSPLLSSVLHRQLWARFLWETVFCPGFPYSMLQNAAW